MPLPYTVRRQRASFNVVRFGLRQSCGFAVSAHRRLARIRLTVFRVSIRLHSFGLDENSSVDYSVSKKIRILVSALLSVVYCKLKVRNVKPDIYTLIIRYVAVQC